MRLRGRMCVVTGGGSGIGRAIARGMASHGAAVAVADIDRVRAKLTAEAIAKSGGEAFDVAVDVSRRNEVDAMMAAAVDVLGRLDILVCSAGIGPTAHVTDITEDEWDRVLDVNLKGLFLCGQAAARHMTTGGSIINITSQLSDVAQPETAHYAASKGGGKMLTKAMALDLANRGIKVNAIAPGLTNTSLTGLDTEEGRASHEPVIAHIPMGRPAEPDELVGAAIYLASDDVSYVTGTTIVVDGATSQPEACAESLTERPCRHQTRQPGWKKRLRIFPMTRSELITRIAERYPFLTPAEAERIVASIFDEIGNSLASGRRVELRGFGSFSVRERQARVGRNPRTGERVEVEAKRLPFFKTGKLLRQRLNEKSGED